MQLQWSGWGGRPYFVSRAGHENCYDPVVLFSGWLPLELPSILWGFCCPTSMTASWLLGREVCAGKVTKDSQSSEQWIQDKISGVHVILRPFCLVSLKKSDFFIQFWIDQEDRLLIFKLFPFPPNNSFGIVWNSFLIEGWNSIFRVRMASCCLLFSFDISVVVKLCSL